MGYRLAREQFLPVPREVIFPFFADAGNLEAITPPWLHFHILTPRPIPMRPGAVIDYRLRLYGLAFRWRTRIESFEPPLSFVDMQIRGPFRRWHHLHEFEEVEGGTRMRDVVQYEMPLPPLGAVAHALLLGRTLRRIFDYRAEVLRRRFPTA